MVVRGALLTGDLLLLVHRRAAKLRSQRWSSSASREVCYCACELRVACREDARCCTCKAGGHLLFVGVVVAVVALRLFVSLCVGGSEQIRQSQNKVDEVESDLNIASRLLHGMGSILGGWSRLLLLWWLSCGGGVAELAAFRALRWADCVVQVPLGTSFAGNPRRYTLALQRGVLR